MSSSVYRDSQWTDQLTDVRRFFESQQGPPNPYSLSYTTPAEDIVNVSDAASVSVNIESAADIVNVSDAAVQTSQATGTFLIDTAQIDFSDIG